MKQILLCVFAATALCALPDHTVSLLKRHAGLSDSEIAAIGRGERLVRAISTARQEEVAFVGVTRLPIPINTYVERLRAGTLYRAGENVIRIGRFSESPRI